MDSTAGDQQMAARSCCCCGPYAVLRHHMVHSCCTRTANEPACSFLHQQHLGSPWQCCCGPRTDFALRADPVTLQQPNCTALSVGASIGRQRKMLETKATPCTHGHTVQTVGTTTSSSAQSQQAAPVAAQFNRQLFQAPAAPRPRRPPPALTPEQRSGFATARGPLPPAQVQRQRRRPAVSI